MDSLNDDELSEAEQIFRLVAMPRTANMGMRLATDIFTGPIVDVTAKDVIINYYV